MSAGTCIVLVPAQAWHGRIVTAFRMPGFDGFLASMPFRCGAGCGDVRTLSTCGKSMLSRVLLAYVMVFFSC